METTSALPRSATFPTKGLTLACRHECKPFSIGDRRGICSDVDRPHPVKQVVPRPTELLERPRRGRPATWSKQLTTCRNTFCEPGFDAHKQTLEGGRP